MKVIIAGSRDIKDYPYLLNCLMEFEWFDEITEVVSGGAMGVDRMGERWARENKIPVKVFTADWDEYGKSAGPIRNKEMAHYADALVLLWWGDKNKSPGSYNMLQVAKEFGLKVEDFVYVKV